MILIFRGSDILYCMTGRRVLLAEDNALNAEIAREILELTGLYSARMPSCSPFSAFLKIISMLPSSSSSCYHIKSR